MPEAELVPINTQVKGAIAENDDKDFYTFQLTESGILRIVLEQDFPDVGSLWIVGLYSAQDPLFISQRYPLQEDRLGKFGDTFMQMGVPAGTYYLQVDAKMAQAIDKDYFITVDFTPNLFNEHESNNEFEQSTLMEINREYSGIITDSETGPLGFINDIDFYHFEIPADANVKVSMRKEAAGNPIWQVYLFADGDTRFFTNEEAIKNSRLTDDNPFFEADLQAGKYYMKVESLNTRGNEIPYLLSANANAANMPYLVGPC